MSDSLFQKLGLVLGFVVIGLMFALLVMMANLEIKDLDLWLHLASGKFVATHGYIPTEDIFSCRLVGHAWNNHEWLFQVLLNGVYQSAGVDGLIFLQVIVVTLTFALLFFLGYSRERQLLVILLLYVVLSIYQQRFTIRPDIFSLLFLTVYFHVLFTNIDRKWTPFVLFGIQVLWTNMHGFFIFGPGIVLISFLSEWGKRRLKLPFEWNKAEKLDDANYRRLKIILGCVFAACLVNPQGLVGALYPFQVMLQSATGESQVFFSKILELQKPLNSFGDLFVFTRYWDYKALILVSLISIAINWRRLELSVLIYWLIFLLFSLSAIRNLVYFAFVSYLVAVVNFTNISIKDFTFVQSLSKKGKLVISIGIKIFLIMFLVGEIDRRTYSGYFSYDTYHRKSEFGGISEKNFPHRAVNFLVKNNVKGNFLNDFNSGAYLIGRAYPNIKVFMDGRTELYGPELFYEYQMAWKGNENVLDDVVNRYNLTGAFINSIQAPAPDNVLAYFNNKKDWVLVYFNWDAAIFLKDVTQNKDIIEEFRINLNGWKPPPHDLSALGLKHYMPYPNVSRAYALTSMGYLDQAIAEAEEAVRILPNYAAAYKALGHIYLKQQNNEESFYAFRSAKLLNPGDPESRYHLALLFEKKGEIDKAMEQCRVVLSSRPGDVRSRLMVARLKVRMKQYDSAMQTIRGIPKDQIFRLEDLDAIAGLLTQDGQIELAREVLEMALSIDPENKTIQQRLGGAELK